MGQNKYIVKKKKPITSKTKNAVNKKKEAKKKEIKKVKPTAVKEDTTVKEETVIEEDGKEDTAIEEDGINEEIDSTIKVIRISTEKKSPPQNKKLVINKIYNHDNKTDEGNQEDQEEDQKADLQEDQKKDQRDVVIKKKVAASKDCVQLAIKILKKIDPKRQKKKEDVIDILKDYKNQVNDLSFIQAIEYLLDSFENLEEKLEELEEGRKIQEKKLIATKLEKEVFHDRINLDLDKKDREPDENDRIFSLGKKVFSGNNQKYKKPKATDINRFRKLAAPKKDNKLLKKYNI